MEKIVVLSCCENSIPFGTKYIKIGEFGIVQLGRSRSEQASRINGLFIYPDDVANCKVSRNHAALTVIGGEVYVVAKNAQTFVNGVRASSVKGTKIKTNGVLFLGGVDAKNPGQTVVALVRIFNIDDEDFKYFYLIETEYQFHCQFPTSPPQFSLDVRILYSALWDRINVLQHLATLNEDELASTDVIANVIKTLSDNSYTRLLRANDYNKNYKRHYEFLKRDHASLYILAAACCRSFRLKRWFIHQERKLFIIRWFKLFAHEKLAFLEQHCINYDEIKPSEMGNSIFRSSLHFTSNSSYYKVPFVEASSLVKNRKTLLNEGFCYVSLDDMYAPLAYLLENYLTSILKNCRFRLDKIWHDDRLRCVIKYMENNLIVSDRYPAKNGEVVTERNVHKLCDESFPLCMKILQFHLQRDHHLRNGGRFQYTLFLKAIGMPLSNSMYFWKTHFTKRISEFVFARRYSYHIRHAYGLEGKMADYPPQNCAEIIKATPGPLEYHGCPFRVLDENRLEEALKKSGLQKKEYDRILQLSANGAPQNACSIYFELTQGAPYPRSTVVHPNDYFDESRNVRRLQKERIVIEVDEGENASKTNLNGQTPCDPKNGTCGGKNLDW